MVEAEAMWGRWNGRRELIFDDQQTLHFRQSRLHCFGRLGVVAFFLVPGRLDPQLSGIF